MENENEKDAKQIIDFMKLIHNPSFAESLFGVLSKKKEKENPYQNLGSGYELRPIEMTDEKGNYIPNTNKYSNLYFKGEKISEEVFRKGGLGGDYKDGYFDLIHYTKEKDPKKSDNGFSFGIHVIVNDKGEIVFRGNGIADYPSHIGGHLLSSKDYIYDLRTGKAIAPKGASTIRGTNFIIIEHRYSWYDKEINLPLGIYKIDLKTAEITKIDDIK